MTYRQLIRISKEYLADCGHEERARVLVSFVVSAVQQLLLDNSKRAISIDLRRYDADRDNFVYNLSTYVVYMKAVKVQRFMKVRQVYRWVNKSRYREAAEQKAYNYYNKVNRFKITVKIKSDGSTVSTFLQPRGFRRASKRRAAIHGQQ